MKPKRKEKNLIENIFSLARRLVGLFDRLMFSEL